LNDHIIFARLGITARGTECCCGWDAMGWLGCGCGSGGTRFGHFSRTTAGEEYARICAEFLAVIFIKRGNHHTTLSVLTAGSGCGKKVGFGGATKSATGWEATTGRTRTGRTTTGRITEGFSIFCALGFALVCATVGARHKKRTTLDFR
jgi:hypothetical protein